MENSIAINSFLSEDTELNKKACENKVVMPTDDTK